MQEKLVKDALKQIEFPEVLELISKFCYSELGKELILSHVPKEETFWIRRELEYIEEMLNVLTLDDPLPFEGLTDIRQKLYKSMVVNTVLSSDELLSVADFFRVSRFVKSYFRTRYEKYPNLSEHSTFLHENRMTEKHITEAIDDTGNIKDTASRELGRIRHEIREKSARLRIRMQKILKRVSEESMLQEDFISLREGRFVLPVKAENKRQIPGIIHGVSQTGATVFLEPSEIIEMNNELSLLANEEKREIYRILGNLTKEVGDDARDFLRSVEILSHIDSLMAKARFALDFGGIKPEIMDENWIYMRGIRHPLLVASKGAKKVIPLNIEFKDDLRGHLISGPNAGGKTVALKSVGVNIAMALSGIFPLGECKTNYRTLFSLIGDHQSITNDLSTFSSQILKMKDIIDNCTKESLVLIDEIGSGTDPQEGSALSAGILDTFLELKLFFIATTHQSSLKSYALTHSEIKNDSLEFDEKNLHPTYKFLEGIPGNSYAFVLAENLGLNRLVIERAKKYVGSGQTEMEESIRILQQFKSEAEQFRMVAEEEKLKAEKLRKDYEQRLSDIKAKKAVYVSEAKNEADDILQRANALIENTIKEIREEKRAVTEIRKDFVKGKKEISDKVKSIEDKVKKETKKVAEVLKIGDAVTSESSTAPGIVVEIDESKNYATVDFNGVKFKLELSKLTKTNIKSKTKSEFSDYIKFDAKLSLDLRGMRADEAIRLLEDFISDGVRGHVNNLTIIHGKGTGALRFAVQQYLGVHPLVVSYRDGDLVEGGAGVTIVEV